jgi:CubicO group peptidase (beta-lactamase class C family)
MLGMIVSKISGEPFSRFVGERIFTPAGMTDSSYIDNGAVVPHRAEGYRRTDAGVLRKGWYLGQYLHSRPDDGVLTTARDLAKWVIALEQRKIVNDPSPLWDATVADSGRPLDYSYGWISDTWLGHRRFEHAGGYRTGFHTFIARYPDDDLSVVVLTNCDFSGVRNYVNRVARRYVPGVPDPSVESARTDGDPAATARGIAALQSVRRGAVDESAMYADAVEPAGVAEVQDLLKAAGPFTYAGRRRLTAHSLTMHGHALVDYETLRTRINGDTLYITLYRDASGRFAYVELTN